MDESPRFRLPPLATDGLIAGGLFVLGLLSRETVVDSPLGELFSREPDVWNTVLIAGQTVPLLFRRRLPGWVLGVILTSFVIDRTADYPATFATTAGAVMAFHALGSEWPPRRSLRVGVPVIAAVVGFTFLGAVTVESVGNEDVLGTLIATAVPFYIGREVYQRRRKIEALEERAEAAEREREERARRAVEDERARIARELHDVVAHQMTVMTVQAEGARRIAAQGDGRVTAALDIIRSSGHEALDEMRRMVGLLRSGGDGAELTPQPGVGRLEELVAQMIESGLDVKLAVTGTPRHLPAGVDVNVYRIVQESLTNTLKHGGAGAIATVEVAFRSDGLDITVSDDGRGAASHLDGDSSGHGLVGMRERVALLDGTLTAGPANGGGFRVHAAIPLTP